jgi:hypothetical protein
MYAAHAPNGTPRTPWQNPGIPNAPLEELFEQQERTPPQNSAMGSEISKMERIDFRHQG